MQQEAKDPPGPAWLAVSERVAGLIKTTTTPLLLVFAFAVFFGPISEIVSLLPAKIRAADKVSAGGLTFELQRKAEAAGDPKLAALIGGLSKPAITYFLSESDRAALISYSPSPPYRIYSTQYPQLAAIQELVDKGLLKCSDDLSEWKRRFDSLLSPVAGMSDAYSVKGDNGPNPWERIKERLNIFCERTPDGGLAYGLVIESVAQQISDKREQTNKGE